MATGDKKHVVMQADIVNDLTTGGTSMALSAEMGKALKGEIDGVADDLKNLTPEDIGAVNSSAIDISNTDFIDTLKSGKSGFYRGINVTNAPTTNWWYYVVTCNATKTFATVIAQDLWNSSNVYVARYAAIEGAVLRWAKLATTDYAVNKAGDTMTDMLGIKTGDNVTYLDSDSVNDLAYWRNVHGDEWAQIMLSASRLQYANTLDGGSTWATHNILHTGNKPSGSYTGNGATTARMIDIGGLGNEGGVLINSTGGTMALVTPHGTIYKVGDSTSVTGLSYTQGAFAGGVLTIASDHAALNANGVTYYYQVL